MRGAEIDAVGIGDLSVRAAVLRAREVMVAEVTRAGGGLDDGRFGRLLLALEDAVHLIAPEGADRVADLGEGGIDVVT